jgi:hypothetical protein
MLQRSKQTASSMYAEDVWNAVFSLKANKATQTTAVSTYHLITLFMPATSV